MLIVILETVNKISFQTRKLKWLSNNLTVWISTEVSRLLWWCLWLVLVPECKLLSDQLLADVETILRGIYQLHAGDVLLVVPLNLKEDVRFSTEMWFLVPWPGRPSTWHCEKSDKNTRYSGHSRSVQDRALTDDIRFGQRREFLTWHLLTILWLLEILVWGTLSSARICPRYPSRGRLQIKNLKFHLSMIGKIA